VSDRINDTHFQAAWTDLGERITGGQQTLTGMALTAHAKAADAANVDERARASAEDFRITRKAAGMDRAAALYAETAESHASPGRYVEAWRTLTDRLFTTWQAAKAADEPETAEGIALALSYQRGYGHEIDAPPLHLLAGATRR
jgi:hypothetical protein